MAAWDWLTGSQKMQQVPTMLPQQQQALMSMLQGAQGGPSSITGSGYLQSLFSQDPSAFAEYEAPAMRQFSEQIVPGIAERFTGMGAGGRSSSAFNQTMGQAGRTLSENLSAQRANLRSGAMNQVMQMLGMGMQPSFENVMFQKPGMLQGLGQGAGAGLGMGAMYGMSGLPSWLMSLFSPGLQSGGGMQ